jgi:hypothetical protein
MYINPTTASPREDLALSGNPMDKGMEKENEGNIPYFL